MYLVVEVFNPPDVDVAKVSVTIGTMTTFKIVLCPHYQFCHLPLSPEPSKQEKEEEEEEEEEEE